MADTGWLTKCGEDTKEGAHERLKLVPTNPLGQAGSRMSSETWNG